LRGLFTTQAVEAGETLFAVPCSLALVSEELLHASPSARMLCEQLNLLEHERLAVLLLERLRQGDMPSCFVGALPDEFMPGPTWLWNEDELAILRNPKLASISRWRREECHRLHAEVGPLWRTSGCVGEPPTLSEVEWAVAIVTSRMLSAVDAETGESEPVLLPIGDMMNHDPHEPGVRLTREASTYIARSVDAIPANAPVTFSYDTHAENAHLLLHFGFLVAPNPHERVEVDTLELYRSVPREAVHRCVHEGLLDGRVDPLTYEAQARTVQPIGVTLFKAVRALIKAAADEDEMVEADETELRDRAREAYAAVLGRALHDIDDDEGGEQVYSGSLELHPERVRLALAYRTCHSGLLRTELEQVKNSC